MFKELVFLNLALTLKIFEPRLANNNVINIKEMEKLFLKRSMLISNLALILSRVSELKCAKH